MSNNSKNAHPEIGSQLSTRLLLFHHAVADHLGLSPTDHKCLLFLYKGSATPGYLAKSTGLAPSSITSILDRLEEKGFISRSLDPKNRRQVLVRLNPARVQEVQKLFDSLGRSMDSVMNQFSDSEKVAIDKFMALSSQVLLDETIKLRVHESE